MSGIKGFFRKVPFLANGEALIGLVFLVSGVAVLREGLVRLKQLWLLFRPYFPLSLSDTVTEWAVWSFPFIFSTFITVIGSICAVIIGGLWLVSGLIELIQSRRISVNAGRFAHPELAPESLLSGRLEHWKSFPWAFRVLARHWPRVRLISPVSLQIVREVLVSVLKIGLLALLIAVLLASLPAIPALLKRFFQVAVTLAVPSGWPLYFLLLLLTGANLFICLSVIPFRPVRLDRSREIIPVHGGGDSHLFFALLEEGCKLLSPKGGPPVPPARFEAKGDPVTKGTLIESRPEPIRTFLRPAGYVCLPLAFLAMSMGFSRLVNFRISSVSMHYSQFIGTQALHYVLEVAFALGLILSGLYLAQWARRLFAVRQFGSSLVFCCMRPERVPDTSAQPGAAQAPGSRQQPGTEWKLVNEVDDHLAAWARRPQSVTRFRLELCWAHLSSESAEEDGPRFLVNLSRSEALESAMKCILDIPFRVNFRTDGPELPADLQDVQIADGAPVKEGPLSGKKIPPKH